ncbi:MAG TPA: lamin tail domain-containing protein, partial [Thermoguttaceae bacterium]
MFQYFRKPRQQKQKAISRSKAKTSLSHHYQKARLQLEALEPRWMLDGTILLISEFMADNTSTLPDGDGDFSDWIEIYNPNSTAVNLDGWHLTDNAGNLDKWPFPAI